MLLGDVLDTIEKAKFGNTTCDLLLIDINGIERTSLDDRAIIGLDGKIKAERECAKTKRVLSNQPTNTANSLYMHIRRLLLCFI